MVVGDFNSPSHRIRGDEKLIVIVVFNCRNAKLVRFPVFNLCMAIFSECFIEKVRYAHHLHRISRRKAFDLPLLIVRRKPKMTDIDPQAPAPLRGP